MAVLTVRRRSGSFAVRGRPKYGAVPTMVNGIRFASKAEARRYQELRLLEQAGQIRWLTVQPKFTLEVNGAKVCEYRGDFKYDELVGDVWTLVVEDVKGVKTPVYRLKAKLMQALHGITIRETR